MTPKTNKIIEEFKKKYKDYLERAYNEIPDRNLGDEMVSDISRALVTQRAEIIREIEEGLPKEKTWQEDKRHIEDNNPHLVQKNYGYNQYRREVKEFLKRIKQ